MQKQLLTQKAQAFGLHLLLSLILAGLSLILVYGVWYPSPLAKATGVGQLYIMMLVIDVIIGPILTFIIYRKSKKTLKFDLAIIFFIQISALMYGLYTMFEGKPAWIGYDVDRFQLVRMNEIDNRNIQKADEKYKKPSVLQPKLVASLVPKQNIQLANQILFDEALYGIAPPQRPELYHPIEIAYPQILQRARALTELNKYNDSKNVAKVLSQYPNADSYVPLKANNQDMTVLISKKNGGEIIKIVDLRPWQ